MKVLLFQISLLTPFSLSWCRQYNNLGGGGDDSDEEADYSKMDQGNKKGPVGRWDFDTQEEYSSYMSQKEAMPKYDFFFQED